jgi:hypothetical protein
MKQVLAVAFIVSCLQPRNAVALEVDPYTAGGVMAACIAIGFVVAKAVANPFAPRRLSKLPTANLDNLYGTDLVNAIAALDRSRFGGAMFTHYGSMDTWNAVKSAFSGHMMSVFNTGYITFYER